MFVWGQGGLEHGIGGITGEFGDGEYVLTMLMKQACRASIYNPSREAVDFTLCDVLIGKSNAKREYKTEIQFGRRGSFLIIGLKMLCME